MKYYNFFMYLLFCTLALCTSPLHADKQAKDTRLNIGVLAPLTGDSAQVGRTVVRAVELAKADLPEDLKNRISVTIEDDAWSSKQAVSAFRKLHTTDKVDAMISLSSGISHAIAPLAESAKVPLIAIASDHKIVKTRDYATLLWVTPETEATLAVEEAAKRGYKRIARVVTEQEGVLAISKGFDAANKGKIEVVYDETFPGEFRDFRTPIAKIRSLKDIDAVMVVLLPGQCGLFAKQLREAGSDLPLFSVEMFSIGDEVKNAAGALDGQWYIDASQSENFTTRFEKQYPDAASWAAANVYDAIMLYAQGLEQGVEPANMHDYLRNIKDYTGALGTFSSTDDGRYTLPATVLTVPTSSVS